MKKITLLLLIGFGLISCRKDFSNTPIPEEKVLKIDVLLNKIIDKYPNFNTNDLVKNEALSTLEIKIDSVTPLNYFEEIPLNVTSIIKNPHGKGFLISFYADESVGMNLSNYMHYNLIGFSDEKTAKSINTEKKYLINGKFNKISKIQAQIINADYHYKNDYDIIGDAISPNFYFGSMICEIKSIKEFQ